MKIRMDIASLDLTPDDFTLGEVYIRQTAGTGLIDVFAKPPLEDFVELANQIGCRLVIGATEGRVLHAIMLKSPTAIKDGVLQINRLGGPEVQDIAGGIVQPSNSDRIPQFYLSSGVKLNVNNVVNGSQLDDTVLPDLWTFFCLVALGRLNPVKGEKIGHGLMRYAEGVQERCDEGVNLR